MAVAERETHPRRAHDWAQARVSRDYPELMVRAEAERKSASSRPRERASSAGSGIEDGACAGVSKVKVTI